MTEPAGRQSPRTHLIVEHNPHGHRLMYVALLADRALVHGDRVVIATTVDALTSEEYARHLSHLGPEVEIAPIPGPISLAALVDIAVSFDAQNVVLPDGDRYLAEATFTRSTRGCSVALLMMRPSAQAGAGGRLRFAVKRFLTAIARRRGIRVRSLGGSLDPCNTVSVPDPVRVTSGIDVSDVRARYDLPADVWWVAIAGAIDSRKNPGTVMRAMAALEGRAIGLILAGEISEDVREEVEDERRKLLSRGIPVRLLTGYLSNADLDGLIAVADCCVAAYSNDGSSGIVGKSLALGTMVVAAGSKTLRRQADQAGNAMLWCSLEESALAETLTRARSLGPPSRPTDLRRTADWFADALLHDSAPQGIVQVLLSRRVGGAESVAATLHSEMSALGVDSRILYLDAVDDRKVTRLGRYRDLRRSLRVLRPTAVISHSALPSVYARLAICHPTLLISVLHSATDDFGNPVLNLAERILRPRTTHVVAVSGRQAETYRKHFGDGVPVSVVGNGLRQPTTKTNYREQPQTIITMARVASQKNPLLWLAVAKAVTEKRADVSFTWYGPASHEPDVLSAMSEAQGMHRIRFGGATNDAVGVMAQADLLFHPSDREANSLTLLEAGTVGLPVVCADEVIEELPQLQVSGFVAGDVNDAASAVLRVLDDYSVAVNRAVLSAPHVAAMASPEAMARRYLAIIGEASA